MGRISKWWGRPPAVPLHLLPHGLLPAAALGRIELRHIRYTCFGISTTSPQGYLAFG